MRYRLLGLIGLLLSFSCPAPAAESLPPARDFAADGRVASAGHMPILVFFTSPSCPYCRVVEDLYLRPMQERGDYRGQLLVRKVEVGGTAPLTDFAGRLTDHGAFAGRELAPPLLGYTTPDFYLGYLEAAIEQAIARARDPRTAALP